MKKLLICIFLLHLAPSAYGRDVAKWVFTDYPPANYQTAEGRYTGFLYDIVIDVFEKRLGVTVEVAVFPWKRCQYMVKNGSADLMVTIPTPQRLAYCVTHDKPVWIKRRILFTYAGHPRIDAINRISGLTAIREGGYTLVSYIGNGWVENTIQTAGIPVLYSTSVKGMYRMLAGERGDLIAEEKNLVMPLVKALGLAKTIIPTQGIASESGFHILVSKRSVHAASISRINQEIEAMHANGELDRIVARYASGAE